MTVGWVFYSNSIFRSIMQQISLKPLNGRSLSTNLYVNSLCLVLLACALSGCLGATLSTLEDLTAGQGKRISSLNQAVAKFHKAVYWDTGYEAAKFVAPEAQATFANKFRSSPDGLYQDKEKLVDINIEGVEFDPEVNRARVEVLIKYFKVPQYVVQTRKQSEIWSYHRMDGGWLLSDPDHVGASPWALQ